MNKIMDNVKEQLARDYNCSIEDFNNKGNLVTDIKEIVGCRNYNKEFLKMLIIDGKAIISVDPIIKDWCIEKLGQIPGEWMFMYSILRRIDQKLNEYGYEIEDTHHYYVPDINNEQRLTYENVKWIEEEEIKQFEGDERVDEVFIFDESCKDILGIAALDENGEILGMSGATADSDIMWQIGVNVLPNAQGKGIGPKIVSMLKDEILKRGKIPFYGTSESHIVSQKVAIKAGFIPAFAEIKIRKMKDK